VSNKDNLYIAMLKYGRTKLDAGVSYDEMSVYLKEKGYSTSGMNIFFNDSFCRLNDVNKVYDDYGASEKCFLRAEGYFNLLEYEELNEARASSRKATRIALAAIVLSIATALISIGFSINQVNSPTRIDPSQLELINTYPVIKVLDELKASVDLQTLHLSRIEAQKSKLNKTGD